MYIYIPLEFPEEFSKHDLKCKVFSSWTLTKQGKGSLIASLFWSQFRSHLPAHQTYIYHAQDMWELVKYNFIKTQKWRFIQSVPDLSWM